MLRAWAVRSTIRALPRTTHPLRRRDRPPPCRDRLPMSIFLLKRLLMLAATLLGASAVVFGVLEVLPGNAAQTLMGPDAAPEAVHALAAPLGPDQPAWPRYLQGLRSEERRVGEEARSRWA